MTIDVVRPEEIAIGLVLHLDPEVLLLHGATYSCAEAFRVKGAHFFVCVAAAGVKQRWVPLYSKTGPGRRAIPTSSLRGHAKWTGLGEIHWHPSQVWEASIEAIQAASKAALDQSTFGARNSITVAAVPTI